MRYICESGGKTTYRYVSNICVIRQRILDLDLEVYVTLHVFLEVDVRVDDPVMATDDEGCLVEAPDQCR